MTTWKVGVGLRVKSLLALGCGFGWCAMSMAQGPLTLSPPSKRRDVPSCVVGVRHNNAQYGKDFQCLYNALTAAFIYDLRDVPGSWLLEHARKSAELARRSSVIARTPSFPHVVAARLQILQLTMKEQEPTHERSVCALAKQELETACIDDLCSAPTIQPTTSPLNEALTAYASECNDRVQCGEIVRVPGPQCHEGWRLARTRINDVFAAETAAVELGSQTQVSDWAKEAENLRDSTRRFITGTGDRVQLDRLDQHVVELGSKAALGLGIEKARRDEEALKTAQLHVQETKAQLLAEKKTIDGSSPTLPPSELAVRRSEVSRELARLDSAEKQLHLKLTETRATQRDLQQITPSTKPTKTYRSAIDSLVNLSELDASTLVEKVETTRRTP